MAKDIEVKDSDFSTFEELMESKSFQGPNLSSCSNLSQFPNKPAIHPNPLIHPHDTCEISEIYLQRPPYQLPLSLGHWFTCAHHLDDKELKESSCASIAKKLIWKRKYTNLSLEPLIRYNAGIGPGEGDY